jgi:DUF4097 and DUF4098 domain-containing protein YvlB
MRRLGSLVPLLLTAAALAGCDASPNSDVTAGQGDAKAVNGSVHVPAGQHSGAVGTVNGAVEIGENASVSSARVVNGPVELDANASAGSVTAVNGAIELGSGAKVTGEVKSVNGAVTLASGADVSGSVINVNGHITLTDAHVGGGLRTVAGDIDVKGNSRLEGGILVEKPVSLFFNSDSSRKPRIVIGPGAVVQGNLKFEREVDLYVSDKATIGPVEGAKPISFSGDAPPG